MERLLQAEFDGFKVAHSLWRFLAITPHTVITDGCS
jgi:hypothetical protein